MNHRSTEAMEEGVKNSDNFILILTHDDEASEKAAADAAAIGAGRDGDGAGSDADLSQLFELVELYKDGYLTEAEFTRAKARLLGSS